MDAEKAKWVEEAVEAGRVIGLADAAVRSAYNIVLNAFGYEWLTSELSKCDRKKFGGIWAGHSLVHMLQMGQPQQTSAVVELSVYLNAFSNDPHVSVK